MNLYGGVFSMKRVAYSVETKMKAVEMKLAGYSTYDIMDTLNIKNKTQVKVWFKWYKNGETHRFYREVGKLSNKGQKSNKLPEVVIDIVENYIENYNDFRIQQKLGYLSPVKFRELAA